MAEQLFEEKLSIRNFFSIERFDWDIENFNVLIGAMASGKSVAMKLLFFFEKAPIFLAEKDQETMDEVLNRNFNDIFGIKDKEQKSCKFENTELSYLFRIKQIDKEEQANNFEAKSDDIFNLKASWDEKKGCLKWETLLDLENIKNLKDNPTKFFPLQPLFIPACRALASVKPLEKDKNEDGTYIEDYIENDFFLKKFLKYKELFLKKFNELKDIPTEKLEKITTDLEKILDIRKIKTNGEKLIFENKSYIERDLDKLASGQAENLYLLPLIYDIDYAKENPLTSLFIEEPDAHLFPDNQLEVIKFLFKKLNEVRQERKEGAFFISTHSTYILDRICTILLNGKAESMGKESIKELPFFNLKDIAVYVIKTHNQKRTTFVERLEIHENGYFIDDPMLKTVDKMSEDNKKLFKNMGA